jgi:radical SAM protein with 4Fe4S-binding SPASM domain
MDLAQGKIMTDFFSQHPAFTKLPYEGRLTHNGKNRSIYLGIETVNTCNNKCIICAYVEQERPKRTLPMELFRKALTDYEEIGGGYVTLTPLVGDIFMDKLLPDRMEFIRTAPGITGVGVTTNGAMAHRFDDAELTQIVRGFSRISLSVYGIEQEENETITRRTTFPQMIDGMRRIITFAEKPISLEFRLLNKRSKHYLFDWLWREVVPDMDEREFARKVRINSAITDYSNWGIYDQKNNPLPSDAKWYAFEAQQSRPQCLVPMFGCMVFSDGSVSFCACDNFNNVPELRLGNIAEHSLAELYNSEQAAALWNWEKHGTPEFCKNCTFHIPVDILKERPSILTDPHQVCGAG